MFKNLITLHRPAATVLYMDKKKTVCFFFSVLCDEDPVKELKNAAEKGQTNKTE